MKKKIFFLLFGFFHLFLLAQPSHIEDSISHYNKITNYNLSLKKINKAIYYTNRAIDYSLKHNLPEQAAFQNFKLGKILYSTQNYDEALLSFHKSINYYDKISPDKNKGLAFFYLGLTNVFKEKYKTSEKYFKKSHNLLYSLGVVDTLQTLDLISAKAYLQKHQYGQAKNIFNKVIQGKNTAGSASSKSEAYYQLGVLDNIAKKDSAIFYLESALSLNREKDDLEQKSKILLAISRYYKNQQNYDRAYTYLEEHFQLKNHIDKTKNAKNSYLAYKKYKEKELYDKKHKRQKEIVDTAKTKRYSQLVSILAIGLISILSLLSISLYKNNKIRNKSHISLQAKNDELVVAKDKVEKASKARADFLSTVSHELRTPLNAINGITHLLLEENPKKSQLRYLESLKFSGNYLTIFINQILEINRLESSKIELEQIPFNLQELLTNIKSSLKEMISANNNKLRLVIDKKIPNTIIGDPTKIAQILMNLINNALKFTKNGVVKVVVKLNKVEDYSSLFIDFEITDNGIGIPEDKLEDVFESFSQGSVEINRKYGGTGLGLAIVKKLVEVMGGNIILTSEVYKGSSFKFTLKFQNATLDDNVTKTTSVENNILLNDKKILLVEDNKINQLVTKKMLEKKGMVCDVIENGEDAIEILKTKKYDLVLMDVHLPGINGTIATKEIRKFDNSTPIIALTAISLDENRESLMAYGMNDVITKPFIPEEFYITIAKYLSPN